MAGSFIVLPQRSKRNAKAAKDLLIEFSDLSPHFENTYAKDSCLKETNLE
ncbi:MAG: hypothetical protein WDO71_04635 [Bacteroidota bacterium]